MEIKRRLPIPKGLNTRANEEKGATYGGVYINSCQFRRYIFAGAASWSQLDPATDHLADHSGLDYHRTGSPLVPGPDRLPTPAGNPLNHYRLCPLSAGEAPETGDAKRACGTAGISCGLNRAAPHPLLRFLGGNCSTCYSYGRATKELTRYY